MEENTREGRKDIETLDQSQAGLGFLSPARWHCGQRVVQIDMKFFDSSMRILFVYLLKIKIKL